MAVSACCSSRQPRLQEIGLQWEVVPRCNHIFSQSNHNVMRSASPISLCSREAHLLEKRSRGRPGDASQKIPLRCAAMATYGTGAQCCAHAREREFCYEQRLARTRIIFRDQSVDDNAVDNVISRSRLSSHRQIGSHVTTMRHESTSVRPGGVLNCQTPQIVRRFSGGKSHVVAQLTQKTSSRTSHGERRGAPHPATQLIGHDHFSPIVVCASHRQGCLSIECPRTQYVDTRGRSWVRTKGKHVGGVVSGECRVTPGPAIVRQVAHAQVRAAPRATPGAPASVKFQLSCDMRLARRRVPRRLTQATPSQPPGGFSPVSRQSEFMALMALLLARP